MAVSTLYTVIVADDEDELREAVCTMIPWEDLGFRLAGSASNGLDALQHRAGQAGAGGAPGHQHRLPERL